MISFVNIAAIAIAQAAPAVELQTGLTSAANAPTRQATVRQCTPHHLPVPSGKGMIGMIMRCKNVPAAGIAINSDDRQSNTATGKTRI